MAVDIDEASAKRHRMTSLSPDRKYRLSVQARTRAGIGPELDIEVKTLSKSGQIINLLIKLNINIITCINSRLRQLLLL